MRHRLLQWILVLLAMACSCPITFGQRARMDSLRDLFGSKPNQEQRIRLLEDICFQYFASSHLDSIAPYQIQLSEDVQAIDNLRLQVLLEFYLAQTFYLDDSVRFFRLSKMALSAAIKSGCPECIALGYLGLGKKYKELQPYSLAIVYLKKGIGSIEMIEAKRTSEIRGILYATLSSAYHQIGGFSHALQFGLDAMRIAEALNDLSLKQKVYSNLSAVYGELSSPNNKLGTNEDRIRYRSLTKKYMVKAFEGGFLLGNQGISGEAAYHLGLFYNEYNALDSSSLYLNKAIAIGQAIDYFDLLSNAYNI